MGWPDLLFLRIGRTKPFEYFSMVSCFSMAENSYQLQINRACIFRRGTASRPKKANGLSGGFDAETVCALSGSLPRARERLVC